MSKTLDIIKETISENYSSSSQVGMGLPKDEIKNRAMFGLPAAIDYKHPKSGETAHGMLHKVKARHYEVKDQKTGEIHKFRYWNRVGYERATGHTMHSEEAIPETLEEGHKYKHIWVYHAHGSRMSGFGRIPTAYVHVMGETEEGKVRKIKHAANSEEHAKEIAAKKAKEYGLVDKHGSGKDYKKPTNEEVIFETLGPGATKEAYIEDFINSSDSRFAGKSREERVRMAIAAWASANKKK